MRCGKIEEILELYRIARDGEWKAWELQSELRKICDNVIAVGDDLSFTLKLDREVREVEIKDGRKCYIHPFKNAYRFEKGFIAFEKNFIRISRELSEERLVKILKSILPED